MPVAAARRRLTARDVTLVVLFALLVACLVAPSAAPPEVRSRDLRRTATTVLDDRALTRAGGWRSVSSSKAYLHTLSKSTKKGATLSSPTTTAAGGSVRLQFGPSRGKVAIWVGGVKRGTVRTARATRKLVTVSFTGVGPVKLTVVRPRQGVYVDSLTVSPPEPPAVRVPQVGEIVVNEVMADPATVPDAAGEWFELTNVTSVDLPMEGCTAGHDGIGTTTFGAFTIPAHGFAVIARSANTADNGGLPPVAATFAFTLEADQFTTTDFITLACHGVEIDRSAAMFSDTGHATGLSSDSTDAASNDLSGHWCENVSNSYGTAGNFGTPGSDNPVCP